MNVSYLQLKSLFKEREGGGEEVGKVDDTLAAAQNGACSAKSKVIKVKSTKVSFSVKKL